MSDLVLCSATEFIAKSNQVTNAPFEHGYSSVSVAYYKQANLEREQSNEPLANALQLASDICSMKLNPGSLNNPFAAGAAYNDLKESWRSAIPDDLTVEQLNFVADVYAEITDPMVKARFADLLWLCVNPKKIAYAQTAIQSYMLLQIDPITWWPDIGHCWERCIKLARQTNNTHSIQAIEKSLGNAFKDKYPDSPFMNLWLAEMIQRHNLLNSQLPQVAEELLGQAILLYSSCDYYPARQYLSLAEQIFKKVDQINKWINCLFLTAECFELEADSSLEGISQSSISANSNYESALQAYRKIPNSHREELGIAEKISQIKEKITDTGHQVLSEMSFFELPGIDISEVRKASINHVKDKQDLNHSILYFTGFPPPVYQELNSATIYNLQNYPLGSLFGSVHYSEDGRVVAKTPAVGLNGEQDSELVIYNKTIQHFNQVSLQLIVEGNIVPALNQILSEFRVTKEHLMQICYSSPIVPEGREYLMASALWSGFEHDFRNSIHLLAPQVEHLIRVRFKKNSIDTTTTDIYGIENENGLSTLLRHECAEDLLGEDLLFELKAVFTESIGTNLRNGVAHGLLNDQSSGSHASVYAWWMVLRLVVRSLYEFETTTDKEE